MKGKKKKEAVIRNNQKGQGVMEYIIISALIGIICLGAVKQFGGVMKNRMDYMRSQIVETIPMR